MNPHPGPLCNCWQCEHSLSLQPIFVMIAGEFSHWILNPLDKPEPCPVQVSGGGGRSLCAAPIAPFYPTAHDLRAEPSAGGFDAPRSFFQSDFDTSEGRADRHDLASASDADVLSFHSTEVANV